MAAVEVALGLKVLLDLFILGLEGSRPLGKELFNDKGKGAALFIDVDGTDDDDVIPFSQARTAAVTRLRKTMAEEHSSSRIFI